MRTLSALLTVLLLCSLQQVCSGTEGSNVPGKCCFKFIKVQIPMKFIISFSKTNSNCPKEAIIFHTVAGMEWCANPKAPWVQESIKKLNS
ncbi:monocyte chemotactic protein 1B-like [Pygocentrus nattereri]|uniref:monocyte chemotactic protein 1B-like n=1 Tax=Pygocentrus nattereri TaxID=42514 RepID=UPI000814457A|nr:monocyte chemotactic protein 1B-like [Pygocentrus nattereri]